MAGLRFSVTLAIDFTGSNGDPRSPSSLHFLDPTGVKRNHYIDAMRSVGNIVMNYAQQQYCGAFGFGGFVSLDGRPAITSHCFPLTAQTAYPMVAGIEGAVQAYVNCLQHVQLSGPTYFAEVIDTATRAAMVPFTPQFQQFHILLLICDGGMNDKDKVVDAIVQASNHPLAIIIVGVGNADFSAMEFLDGDDNALVSKMYGPAKADIVQFVPYNRFAADPAMLAQETLKEIPSIVLSFMQRNRIQPLQNQPPPQSGADQPYVPPQ
eukprot:UN01245